MDIPGNGPNDNVRRLPELHAVRPPPAGIPPGHRIVVDIIQRPNYIVGYEQRDWTTYVHVIVARWDAPTARQFRQDIDAAHALLGRPVYALDDPDNPTLRKFLKLHGFLPHSRTIDVFGRDVAVYERQL